MKTRLLHHNDAQLKHVWRTYLDKTKTLYNLRYYNDISALLTCASRWLKDGYGIETEEMGLQIFSTSRENLAAVVPVIKTEQYGYLLVSELFDCGACYPKLTRELKNLWIETLGRSARSFGQHYDFMDRNKLSINFTKPFFSDGISSVFLSEKCAQFHGVGDVFKKLETFAVFGQAHYRLNIVPAVQRPKIRAFKRSDWYEASFTAMGVNSTNACLWYAELLDPGGEVVATAIVAAREFNGTPSKIVVFNTTTRKLSPLDSEDYYVSMAYAFSSLDVLVMEQTYFMWLIMDYFMKEKKRFAFELCGLSASLFRVESLSFPSFCDWSYGTNTASTLARDTVSVGQMLGNC